mmetsp:Transcript_42845/g.48681  ORF Transcript_42845/g.48681 Transcript_42845/m.48681 type:complete len:256 (-) Transcript_42845:18-785(-)
MLRNPILYCHPVNHPLYRILFTRPFSFRARRLNSKLQYSFKNQSDDDQTKASPGELSSSSKIQENQVYKKSWSSYFSIWPADPPGEPEYIDPDRMRWPKTFSGFRTLLVESWEVYISTHASWSGEPETENDNNKDANDKKNNKVDDALVVKDAEKYYDKVKGNVTKNVAFLETEGKDALSAIKEKTGIHTVQDLKSWAGEQMTLANECLQEFMSGYRQGRDDEVEKMLNDYFQEEEEGEKNPNKRRRPKRRLRTL